MASSANPLQTGQNLGIPIVNIPTVAPPTIPQTPGATYSNGLDLSIPGSGTTVPTPSQEASATQPQQPAATSTPGTYTNALGSQVNCPPSWFPNALTPAACLNQTTAPQSGGSTTTSNCSFTNPSDCIPSASRAAAFIIGLILIAGGVFMLRGPSIVVGARV